MNDRHRLPGLLAGMALAITVVADPGSVPSRDGRHRAVVTARNGTQVLEIRIAATGVTRAALRLGGARSHPVFSPDGHFVAFYVALADRFVLTVSDMSGHSWPVAETAGADGPPSWSDDAVYLYFTDTADGGVRERYRVTAGGTRRVRLTDTPATEN